MPWNPPTRRSAKAGRVATGERIRLLRRLAKAPCNRCKLSAIQCWVGENSGKCASCAEAGRAIAQCGASVNEFTVIPIAGNKRKGDREEGFASNEYDRFALADGCRSPRRSRRVRFSAASASAPLLVAEPPPLVGSPLSAISPPPVAPPAPAPAPFSTMPQPPELPPWWGTLGYPIIPGYMSLPSSLLEVGGRLAVLERTITKFGRRLDTIGEKIDRMDKSMRDLVNSNDRLHEAVENSITMYNAVLDTEDD